MSIDADLYLKTNSFPWEIWNEILEEFSTFDRSEIAWVIDLEDGPIWLDIIKLHQSHIFSEEYCWKIGIHTKSPYTALKIWHMLAIAYRCLIFINDALFFDPYNSRQINNIGEFEAYAKEYLLRFVKLKKIDRYGLLDEKENIKL